MNKTFINSLIQRGAQINHNLNLRKKLQTWISDLCSILFPSKYSQSVTLQSLVNDINSLQKEIVELVHQSKHKQSQLHIINQIFNNFYQDFQQIGSKLQKDLVRKFPSFREKPIGFQQILLLYPEFKAILNYRMGRWLYQKQIQQLSHWLQLQTPSIYLSYRSHISEGLLLHGTKIRIQQGVKIGKNVTLYQGVTIKGSENIQVQNQTFKPPIIQDDVIIYSGVAVIGQKIIIGRNCIIGSHIALSKSLLPQTKLLSSTALDIYQKNTLDKYSIQSLIGNTPLVQIKTIFKKPNVKIFAKLEGQNPGGSVKDRPAYNMIKQAIKRGDIKKGTKLIQPTSGNTGIALAMIASVFGLQIELVMPENSTAQRVQTMEAYGAKVILTPANTGIEGSRDYAEEQVAKGGYKMLNQFANVDNYMAHYHSTGPQIWRDTQGQITHFVSSMGTTGTIMGTSMYLKQKNKEIKIVGVQPTQGSKIPGIRRWTPEYIPKIFDRQRVDKIIDVSQQQSLVMMRRLAKQEAIFSGMSSGGAMAAAVRLAQTLQAGVIVSIVCDRGDRYLSSGIFTSKTQ